MPAQHLHALLVEEDDAYAGRLQLELAAESPAPVALEWVRSVPDAIARFSTAEFDVVLLSLAPPGSRGEPFERLQQAAGDTPIVVLTAIDDDRFVIDVLREGAEDCLVKARTGAPVLARSLHRVGERARAQRRLAERAVQAHKMEAVGRLAGGIAHDFNNLLTAIFGYTDLLLEQLPAYELSRNDVQEIRRSAERAASLTRQLLAFSRKQVLQPRVIDLNAVITGVEPLLRLVVGSDVAITVHRNGPLSKVRADPRQMEQVLMNLCANARDAMPDGGGIEIRTADRNVTAEEAATRAGLQTGAYVLVTVSDTGPGIPEAIRPHIFEPFFTTKEQGKGTGLGLATVYGIVKQSGGGVYLDDGGGSTFSIYLPSWSLPSS
jgi:two-component system, cell cycle sensor histidine kinase and response regulator CckA